VSEAFPEFNFGTSANPLFTSISTFFGRRDALQIQRLDDRTSKCRSYLKVSLWFWKHYLFFRIRKIAKHCRKRVSFSSIIKPWPNGVASRRKLRTCVYLRLRLARSCAHLRWLAMTCAHFGGDQICTQVDASFSPFGYPIQVNAIYTYWDGYSFLFFLHSSRLSFMILS